MTTVRRCLQALGYVLLGLTVLVVIGFTCLVVANWKDDPLSEAAQQALQYTPPTEAALQGNGYLILLGLDADPRIDPVSSAIALGRKRLTREIERRQWAQTHGDDVDGMPPSVEVSNASAIGDDILPTALRCQAGEIDCFSFYSNHRAHIEQLLQTNQPALARYAAAAYSPTFINPAPIYLFADFPPFARLVKTHELLLASASLQWTNGQPEQAITTVHQAALLRVRLADNADTLLTSMIALAMHYRELRWLSNAVAYLSPTTPPAVPTAITELLQIPPATLEKTFDGEKRFVGSLLYSDMRNGVPADYAAPWDGVQGGWQSLKNRALSLGFLPQQTVNLSIANLQQIQTISTLPAHQTSAAFDAYSQQWTSDLRCGTPWHLRNVLGRCLADVGISVYQNYVQRISDIDGYRRLVLLQQQALAQHITAANLPAWLAQSPPALRNPYTLAPMQWDAATNSLVFEGKQAQTQNPDGSATYRVPLRLPVQP